MSEMPGYILRLIAEAENHRDSLELRVSGAIPRINERFILEKEYPSCIVTYRVASISINIKIPKESLKIYQTNIPIVSALREPGGFKKR